ncbi:leucine-rich repeat-containing protein, partial [Trifolium medium]|nr:leucine-rich repeat-containing protein [Trifolium medium]
VPAISSLSNQLGYSSDTLEPKQIKALRHVKSSVSITTYSRNNSIDVDDQRRSRFQKQWFSFSTESSSYARVDAWVKDLEIQEPVPEDDLLDDNAEIISFPPSPEAGRPMIRNISQMTHTNSNLSKDILKANCMVQSLNPASSIAHISGVGIKAIPIISHFFNLRSVNLSNNFIGITSGVQHI